MMSKAEQLGYAQMIVNSDFKRWPKKSKRQVLEKLASFGYGPAIISKLTGVSVQHALDYAQKGSSNLAGSKWNPRALDAMRSLAMQYSNGHINGKLVVNLAYHWHTGLKAQAYFTGIPIAELREALRGEAL